MRKHRKFSIFMLVAILYVILCAVLYPLQLPSDAANSSNGQNGPGTSATSTAVVFHGVTYHRGAVLLSPAAYLIFWGNDWLNKDYAPPTVQLIKSYFARVGGTSYMSVLTQYYMQNAAGGRSTISNSTQFSDAQVWIDPTNPQTGNSDCGGPTIGDQAIQGEVARAISLNHWPRDGSNAAYFVFSSQPYFAEEPGFGCSDKDLCGDHEWSSQLGVAYAIIPYPKSTVCQWATTPPGVASTLINRIASTLVVISAHEQFETITDPNAPRATDFSDTNHGWYFRNQDKNVLEIGDLCAASTYMHIRVLHGQLFLLPGMWSNLDQRCI